MGIAGNDAGGARLGLEDEWRDSAELLWAHWDPDTDLFNQHLGDRDVQSLGPAHGFAGNVNALRGFVADEVLRERVAPVMETAGDARRGRGQLAAGASDDEKVRVQWCHGAPGIISTIGDLLPWELALAGGELTWRAGPLRKGPGLCHGTAGNGYAFLRLHALTGDSMWLDRARRFAVHAVGSGPPRAPGARPRPLQPVHRGHRRGALPARMP